MTPARNKSDQELHNEKLSSVNFGISYILGDSFGKMASSEVSSPLSDKSFQDIEAISGTDGNSPQPWDIFCPIFVDLESFWFASLITWLLFFSGKIGKPEKQAFLKNWEI